MKYVKWMFIIMLITAIGGFVVGITGKTAGTVLVVELIITGCIIVWLFVSKMIGYVKKESENTSLNTKDNSLENRKNKLSEVVADAMQDGEITSDEFDKIFRKQKEAGAMAACRPCFRP